MFPTSLLDTSRQKQVLDDGDNKTKTVFNCETDDVLEFRRGWRIGVPRSTSHGRHESQLPKVHYSSSSSIQEKPRRRVIKSSTLKVNEKNNEKVVMTRVHRPSIPSREERGYGVQDPESF